MFTAFASSIDRLVTEQTGQEDLGSLHAVLDNALNQAAELLPSRARGDASARMRADAALARLLDRR